jgi:hypothetical protein
MMTPRFAVQKPSHTNAHTMSLSAHVPHTAPLLRTPWYDKMFSAAIDLYGHQPASSLARDASAPEPARERPARQRRPPGSGSPTVLVLLAALTVRDTIRETVL